MTTRDEFLGLIWKEIINSYMSGAWIQNSIAQHQDNPSSPFADVGESLQRLIALGADYRDLSLVVRGAAYEAIFQLLYMLDDPGVEEGEAMLHESLLSADPSGLEGRPGSAP